MPPRQNSYYGSEVIFSCFDSLLKTDKSGLTQASAAKDWLISDDYKEIQFSIDTSKRFSDGTNLKASDVKAAWEDGLRENPNAYNSNTGDVFYHVEGIEDFAKTGTVSGFVVKSDDILIIKFKKPFRKAIDALKGARFAVFKRVGNSFIGTGKYVVKDSSKSYTYLIPNRFIEDYRSRPDISINVVEYKDALKDLKSNKIDFFFSAGSTNHTSYNLGDATIKAIHGQDNLHSMIEVNGIKGRFFDEPKLRLAFQTIMAEIAKENEGFIKETNGIRVNLQVYLPFQSGRLSDDRVRELISKGKEFVPLLIEKSKKSPLIFYYHPEWAWLMPKMKDKGINFSDKSLDMVKAKINILDVYYKTNAPDIITGKASYASGDPDGLYHLLGHKGAIASKMAHREKVADALENGRTLLKTEEINKQYKFVSELVLEEVPFFHFGTLPSLVLYNSEKVVPYYEVINRNESIIDSFRLK